MVQQVSQGGIIDLIALLRARARQGLQGRGAVLAAEHRKLERVEPIQQPAAPAQRAPAALFRAVDRLEREERIDGADAGDPGH